MWVKDRVRGGRCRASELVPSFALSPLPTLTSPRPSSLRYCAVQTLVILASVNSQLLSHKFGEPTRLGLASTFLSCGLEAITLGSHKTHLVYFTFLRHHNCSKPGDYCFIYFVRLFGCLRQKGISSPYYSILVRSWSPSPSFWNFCLLSLLGLGVFWTQMRMPRLQKWVSHPEWGQQSRIMEPKLLSVQLGRLRLWEPFPRSKCFFDCWAWWPSTQHSSSCTG